MKAWQLLEDPKHWTQGELAEDKKGRPVDPDSPDAVCWCIIGACRKLYTRNERHPLYNKLRQNIPVASIVQWNDSNTHATVLAKLKELDI